MSSRSVTGKCLIITAAPGNVRICAATLYLNIIGIPSLEELSRRLYLKISPKLSPSKRQIKLNSAIC